MNKKLLGLAMAGLLLTGCSAKTAITTTTTAETTMTTTTATTTTTAAETTTTTAATTTATTTTTPAWSTPAYDFAAEVLTTPAEGTETELLPPTAGKELGVELTINGIQPGRLTITLTNLTEKSQRVTIPAYQVDGLYVGELVCWKLAPQQVLETELPLPELALKWLGRENVMKVLLEAMETRVETDVPWDAPAERAEAVELTLTLSSELAEAPNGTVLWEEEGESLTALGVDYEDAACPQVMLQLNAKMPAEDEVQRTLFASVEVIAVNGETVADGTELFLPAGEMAVEALKLSGIVREDLAVPQPVGKVNSLTLRYTIREGQVGAVIAESETELDGENLTHWGNPDAWKDMSGK